MTKFLKKRFNKKGFTLIELIVVIAILAILAAIAIPAYTAYKKNAAIAADAATCKVIYDAAQMDSATDGAADKTDILKLIGDGTLTDYPAPQNKDVSAFTVTINASGVCTQVSAGTTTGYPDTTPS